MTPRPRARVRLLDVDTGALVADYEGGVTVEALCHTYGIGLSRLYRVLDENHIPRRKQSRPRVALDVQRKIVADYAGGEAVAMIASRHGVSTSAVSDIARRYWRHRQPVRERDELIRLVVAWLMGTRLSPDDLDAVMRVGVATSRQGVDSIANIDPALRPDVVRGVIDAMRQQWLASPDSPRQGPGI